MIGESSKEFNSKVFHSQTRKFLQIAKDSLDPTKYCDLVDILCVFNDGESDKSTTCRELRRIVQRSGTLEEMLGQLLPEPEPHDTQRASSYIEEIKSKGDDVYDAFVGALKRFQDHEISLEALTDEASKILRPFPELFEEFKEFSVSDQHQEQKEEQKAEENHSPENADGKSAEPEPEPEPVLEPEPVPEPEPELVPEPEPVIFMPVEEIRTGPGGEKRSEEEELLIEKQYFAAIKDALSKSHENYTNFFKCIHLYSIGIINLHETMSLIESYLCKWPQLLNSLGAILESREKNRRQVTWVCRPLSDFHPAVWSKGRIENPDPVVVQAERVGSYTRLPEIYPPIISTGRTPKLEKEINDLWITVARGSEDFSFKIMRRNIFEESLFRCEDERFELDVAINNLNTTIDFLIGIQHHAKDSAQRGDVYRLGPEVMGSFKLRILRKLYGNETASVLSGLQADPLDVIPTLLNRIALKREECLRIKQVQNKVWKDVCEKNFYKSLDHKAFYFKQTERKMTNIKNFVQEIKQRFAQRFSAPVKIKRGGTSGSIYFNSLSALPPEGFHNVPDPDDDIAKLSDEEVNKYADKMPQYQMLWKDKEIFKDMINLILYQIEVYRNGRGEKDKITAFFKKLTESFFMESAERTCEFDYYSASDVQRLVSDSFCQKRLKSPLAPINEIIESMKLEHLVESEEDKLLEMQKKLKASRSRGSRAMSHGGGPAFFELRMDCKEAFGENGLNFQTVETTVGNALFLPTNQRGRNLLYGSQHYYGLVRHMHCLYERLMKARQIISHNVSRELEKNPEIVPAIASECYVDIFLKGLRTYIGGNIDTTKYEDLCRHYLGQQAYLLFTIESLMSSIIKMLQQHLVADDVSVKSLDLYFKQNKGELPEQIYFHEYNKMLLETGGASQNTFRFLYNPNSRILSIHYYEDIYDGMESAAYFYTRQYIKSFVHSSMAASTERPRQFLARNVRRTKEQKLQTKCPACMNGLSAKILPGYNTLMVYGADEEDFMLTHKRPVPEDAKTHSEILRSQRYRKIMMNTHSN